MHLSLNGWPPIASHCAFLLFGFIAANMTQTTTLSQEKIYEKKVLIPANSDLFKDKGILTNPSNLGKLVLLTKTLTYGKNSKCTALDRPIVLLQQSPFPAVNMSTKDASQYLLLLLNKKPFEKFHLELGSKQKDLKKCETREEITYGSP
ncbi:MAG: hypothetical protein R3B45_07420 [Bdellovibrionota bacterium]